MHKSVAKKPRPARLPAALAAAPTEALSARLRRVVEERNQLRARNEELLTKWPGRPDLKDRQHPLNPKAKERAGTIERLKETCSHYTSLFHSAPMGYVVLNARGQIQEFNEACARLLGMPQGLLIRQFLASIVVREDVPKFLAHLNRCKAATQSVSTELRLRRKTAPPLPVEVISLPVEDPADHYTRLRTAIVDLTHRRQAEAALQHLQQNYHALVDSIEGLVWEGRVEADSWRFTFVSKQAEKFLGYPSQRWLLEPDFWEHRLRPEDRATVLAARTRALADGKDHVLEYRMINAERATLWVRDSVTPEGLTSARSSFYVMVDKIETPDPSTVV